MRGVKELRLVRVGFDLLAQSQDRLIDGPVCVRHVSVTPDDMEQLVPVHDAVRALREVAEYRELSTRQLDRLSRAQRARVLEVDRDAGELQTQKRGARPPKDCENARDELLGVEGLRHVILPPPAQPPNLPPSPP